MAAEQVVHAPAENAEQTRLEAAKAVGERLAKFLDELAASRGVPARPAKVSELRPPLETKDEIWVSQGIFLEPEPTMEYIDSVEDVINGWIEALEPGEQALFDGTLCVIINWA